MSRIYPIILSGGSGSRLWPLSRESFPKQLLALNGPRSLLQDTVTRVADPERFHPVTVIANKEHRFVIAEQLREIEMEAGRIILEPAPRNTAAAVACAALACSAHDPKARLLVMPADHVILDTEAFLAAVDIGLEAADQDALVLFGMQPDSPATGYGYIRTNGHFTDATRRVASFVEKPDLATAERYVASGEYYWNSGIFLLPAAAIIEELARYAPAVLASVSEALAHATTDRDFLRLDAEAFNRAPTISIDHAVMERSDRCVVAPVEFGWSDVGSWASLWEIATHDNAGNATIGNTMAEDTHRSYLRSEGPLVTTVGVSDLIVVATSDAVLVAHRDASEGVRDLVARLKASNNATAIQTRRMYRPWGSYEGLLDGDRFQVKRITVNPGQKLSLQKHFHRAEHWVVVGGTAEVHVDGCERLISENEAAYIPLGSVHRLTNPGKVPLVLIEVQSGPYLGEDDIVRLDDVYSRV